MTFLKYVLGPIVGAWLFTGMSLWFALRHSRRNLHLSPLPRNSQPELETYAGSYDRWTAYHRFSWYGAYLLPDLTGGVMAVWRHQDHPVYFSLRMVSKEATWEFTSELGREHQLTTTTSSAGEPLPSWYHRQYFPKASLDELWEHHRQAHCALLKNGKVAAVALDQASALPELYARNSERYYAHLTSVPLWWLRVPYWMFVSRRQVRNKQLYPGPYRRPAAA